MKSTIVNRKVDFFFSVFPIWVPILYFFFLISFPNFENLIFILTMLILGETHFGITWLIFAAYIHARLTKGWVGEKAALLGSIGFIIVWICYLGVNFLGQGLHSYGFLS